ncbi:hypothetical protein GIB67_023380 [Kingdonia uniflora]|uniref:Uncharacterized protein n=1 Tax=Kingdonia uniflora TaxID=39325 RepID=A0A7J7LI94_9MAGN|nr:hypothetical protein GIB67_023380 [Kingdonia uniflora]
MNTTRAITEVLSSQLKKKLFIQPLITPRCSLSTKSSTSSSSSSMQPKIKDGSRRMKRREVEDTLWKDLVENPNQWWDNRNNKIHPKGPDFMHKDSWKGLWLNVAPKWVDMLNLEELEFRRRKGVTARSREFLESLWKNLVEKPTQWMDNRKIKVN